MVDFPKDDIFVQVDKLMSTSSPCHHNYIEGTYDYLDIQWSPRFDAALTAVVDTIITTSPTYPAHSYDKLIP